MLDPQLAVVFWETGTVAYLIEEGVGLWFWSNLSASWSIKMEQAMMQLLSSLWCAESSAVKSICCFYKEAGFNSQ